MPGTFFGPFGTQYDTHAEPAGGNTGRFPLGHKLVLPDGRTYAYALNDGTAEVAGNLYQSVVAVADHTNNTADVARAIGAVVMSATLGATLAAIDIYNEGKVHVNDLAGEGYTYHIKRAHAAGDGHAAVAASGVITVNLAAGESVQVATTTTSQMSFTRNRFHQVLIKPASAATAGVAGVSPGVAAADRYYYSQILGPAAVLYDNYTDAPVGVGRFIYPSITIAGGVGVGRLTVRTSGTAAADVTAFVLLEDAAGANLTLAVGTVVVNTNVAIGVIADPPVGVLLKNNADTDYALVNLMLDWGNG